MPVAGRNNDVIPDSSVRYFAGALTNGASRDMNVNGSSTSVNFTYSAPGSAIVYLTSLRLIMLDPGTQAISAFGSIAGGLSNGLRLTWQINGSVYNFATFTNNGEIAVFFDYSGALLLQGFLDDYDATILTLNFPVPITLDGGQSDYIRWVVQDNLTPITSMQSAVIGYRKT